MRIIQYAFLFSSIFFFLPGCGATDDIAMFRGNLERTGYYDTRAVKELGTIKWKFKAGGSIYSSTISGDNICFGSLSNYFHCLDINNGNEKWAFETQGDIYSTPAISNGVVYFGSSDNYLYALEIESGLVKWKFKAENVIWSSPAVVNELVLFGSADGNFYCLDAITGQERWRFPSASIGTPAVSENAVYFHGRSGFYSVDLETGLENWTFQSGGADWSSPAISNGVVYFGSRAGYFYAVDKETGQEKWNYNAQKEADAYKVKINSSSPAVKDGIVYFRTEWEDQFGLLHAVNVNTGQIIWTNRMRPTLSSPTLAEEILYYGTSEGLRAVRAKNGKALWFFKTESAIHGAATVFDGTIYFGDLAGNLIAVK